jgi:hypothetical protein
MFGRRLLTSSILLALLFALAACSSSSTPSASYSSLVLAAHPSSYWHLDSLAVLDVSGHGNDGALRAPADLVAGPLQHTSSHALQFTGSSSVIVAHKVGLGPQTSLELWVNYSDNTSAVHLLRANGTDASGQFRFVEVYLSFNAPSHFLSVLDFPSQAPAPTATAPITPNAWHYLVLTDDGSTLLLYQDGVAVGSGPAIPALLVPSTQANNAALEFGGGAAKALAEIAIYPNILTSAQIAAHYHAGCAC